VKKYGNKIKFEATDPRGYFMISIENKDIMVKHYTPKGEYIQEFRQNGTEEKASVLMYRKLLLADAVSEISHAFDLGAELQKAEMAIKRGIKYKQDDELKL
jgi:dihydropteroate synthase